MFLPIMLLVILVLLVSIGLAIAANFKAKERSANPAKFPPSPVMRRDHQGTRSGPLALGESALFFVHRRHPEEIPFASIERIEKHESYLGRSPKPCGDIDPGFLVVHWLDETGEAREVGYWIGNVQRWITAVRGHAHAGDGIAFEPRQAAPSG